MSGLDAAKALLLLAAAAAVVGSVFLALARERSNRYEPGTRRFGLRTAVFVFVVGLAVFGCWIVSLGFVIVPPGTVGVQTNFGQVQEQTLGPGLHWVTPFMSQVTNMDTRVQPHPMKEIDAASKEYQEVKITGMLNYHIDPAYASQLFQQVGPDFADKVIDPALNDFVKTVTPEYSVSEILNKRDEIRSRAMDALGKNLSRYHIVVDDIYIANIAFSDEYQKAIEAKQVAAQQVQTEQQVLLQRQIQAQQQVAQAKGQADSQVVIAKGQADSNDLISKSLNAQMLQYLLIQKLGDKISVIFLPTGQQFILDPKALVPTSSAAP